MINSLTLHSGNHTTQWDAIRLRIPLCKQPSNGSAE
jgi:hypothetical protein